MKIVELHRRLIEIGIPERKYYLHGIYGSTNDEGKIALTIRKGKYSYEYITYYKERGEINNERIFFTEEEACEDVYEKLIYQWLFWKMKRVDGLPRMTVNERLYASELIDEFDKYRNSDKTITTQILKLLKVDGDSINKIIKTRHNNGEHS